MINALLFVYLFDIFGILIAIGMGANNADNYIGVAAHYLFWICILTLAAPVVFFAVVATGLLTRFRYRARERRYERT